MASCQVWLVIVGVSLVTHQACCAPVTPLVQRRVIEPDPIVLPQFSNNFTNACLKQQSGFVGLFQEPPSTPFSDSGHREIMRPGHHHLALAVHHDNLDTLSLLDLGLLASGGGGKEDDGDGGDMAMPGESSKQSSDNNQDDDGEIAQSTYTGELPPDYLPPLQCTANPWTCNCSRACQCVDELQAGKNRTERENEEGLPAGFKCRCQHVQCDCVLDSECDKPYDGEYMLSYDGGFLLVEANAAFNFKELHAFTLEAWFRLPPADPTPAVVKCVMSRFNYGKAGQFRWWMQDGKMYFQRETTDNIPRRIASPVLPRDTWFHAAVVYTGRTLVMLIDGLPVAMRRSPEAYDDETTPLLVGACMSQDQYTRPFAGVIDEVRVWTIPRTKDEINEKMFERLDVNWDSHEGLLSYWQSNLGTGRVVRDRGKLKQHAVMHGKMSWLTSPIPIENRRDLVSLFDYKPETIECGVVKPCQPSGDLARGKPTTQISTGWSGDSGRAVDGVPDPNYGASHCTHTEGVNEPWWRVDLGERRDVSTVKVLNRADCCGSRLNGLTARVGDDDSDWHNNAVCSQALNVCTGPDCWLQLACNGVISGRFVYLVIPGRAEYLTLCEVEVYGPETGSSLCTDELPRQGNEKFPPLKETVCKSISIIPPFTAGNVMVQVRPNHRDSAPTDKPHPATMMWLESVFLGSFVVCARETSQFFSGHDGIFVSWLAYTEGKVAGAATGELSFPEFSGVVCQTATFPQAFPTVPFTLATINHRTYQVPPDSFDFGGRIGGGWQLVRRVQRGYNWHPATDNLEGTAVYGNFVNCFDCDATFSRYFKDTNFDEFLFATGDMQKWAIVKKASLYQWGWPLAGLIKESSISQNEYSTQWYRRWWVPEDPWISLRNHFDAIVSGDLLYGGYGWGGAHAANVLPSHNGANVFIRRVPIHDATAVWLEEISPTGCRICVREEATDNDPEGKHDGTLHVSYLAFDPSSAIFSKYFVSAGGGVSLPAFRNLPDGSSPCFVIDLKQQMADAAGPVQLFATVNHHDTSGLTHDAIAVWMEEVNPTQARVCLRELSLLGTPGGNVGGEHAPVVVDWLAVAQLPPQVTYVRWFRGPSSDQTANDKCGELGGFWGLCSYEQLKMAEGMGYRRCAWSRFARPAWDVAVCGECGAYYKPRPGECMQESLRTTPRPSDGAGFFCCHLGCEP
eukprot:c13388_g1_i1.p1 GENE.c13388_g1_i1~~c13388_g1_i1.p1  ORF type:complete len:1190 (+),score=265.94 c13388_g1_i1:32-3601(+)